MPSSPSHSPQDRGTIRPPHPLARELIERLRDRSRSRVLDYSSGSGRNTAALRAAGHEVVGINDAAARDLDALPSTLGEFAAVISTHGFLHGTTAEICRRVNWIADRLGADGLLYATFASTRDARFGMGRQVDALTFAPIDGDECGVAHAYFTRDALEALLKPRFAVERLEEHDVDAIAGSWAHPTQPLSNARHWFVVARVSMRSCIGLDALA